MGFEKCQENEVIVVLGGNGKIEIIRPGARAWVCPCTSQIQVQSSVIDTHLTDTTFHTVSYHFKACGIEMHFKIKLKGGGNMRAFYFVCILTKLSLKLEFQNLKLLNCHY